MRTTTRRVLAAASSSVVLLAPLAVIAPAEAKNPPAKPVTVMTRNIYLGADINRPVTAALTAAEQPGANQLTILTALANATHATRAVVDRTDFGVRGALLADEIAQAGPDLVGLQEVALWRSGPMQLNQVGVPNAQVVDQDFLQMLLDELAERGAPYVAVSVADRADVESPSFTGPITAPGGSPRDVRLTMRDVILMRASSTLTELAEGQDVYDVNLQVGVAGLTFDFDRGYQWVDVRAGAQRFRFVNTHLEAFSSNLAYAQAAELLATSTAPDRTTVLACDCNSDPLNHDVKTDIGDTLPHSAPYELITATYTDEWLRWAPAEEGWTSGLSETVDDATADGFDHRIDMIFTRTVDGHRLGVERGAVTGTSVGDRDGATGLWPSDHGGVVLRLRHW